MMTGLGLGSANCTFSVLLQYNQYHQLRYNRLRYLSFVAWCFRFRPWLWLHPEALLLFASIARWSHQVVLVLRLVWLPHSLSPLCGPGKWNMKWILVIGKVWFTISRKAMPVRVRKKVRYACDKLRNNNVVVYTLWLTWLSDVRTYVPKGHAEGDYFVDIGSGDFLVLVVFLRCGHFG